MKKLTALLLAIAMMVTCTLCAVAEDGKTYMAVCIASEPDTLDPALNSAVDGATMVAHLFAGLSTWAQTDDGKLEILPDCAVELPDPVVNDDGTVTYTYTLVDGLKWSDGKDLTAKDFEFAWKRAASSELGADYGYMFEVIKGYTTDGSDPKAENLAVTAVDNKTLTVTLNNPVAYWNELLAFPAYMPVREDVVANEAWATDPSTYIGNGPYTMTAWEHNSKITLTKNPYYHAVDKVTMDELDFYLSDDANNMLANFQKGDWQLIDDVPTSEIASLKEQYPTEFVIAGQIGTYYVCWNINEEILPADVLANMTPEEAEAARAEIRQAIGLLFDRNYIVEEIGQAGQVPASLKRRPGAEGITYCRASSSSRISFTLRNCPASASELPPNFVTIFFMRPILQGIIPLLCGMTSEYFLRCASHHTVFQRDCQQFRRKNTDSERKRGRYA